MAADDRPPDFIRDPARGRLWLPQHSVLWRFLARCELPPGLTWEQVLESDGPEHLILTGSVNSQGYSRICGVSGHRWAYETFWRQLRPGEVVHHQPDCPRTCCRPSHLMVFPDAAQHRLHEIELRRACGLPVGRPRKRAA